MSRVYYANALADAVLRAQTVVSQLHHIHYIQFCLLALLLPACSHVAGTIGAVGNNGQGVVGVCQSGVKLISTKFLGGSGGSGSTSGAVAALYYLLDLKTRHNLNMVATSNSW